MKLPYYPGAELTGNEKEISDEEYIKMLEDYYSGDYFKYMNNAINGMMDDRYEMTEIIPDKYQIESIESKTVEPSYYTFVAELNTINDTPATYEEILQSMRNMDMTGFIFHLYLDNSTSAADGISEISQWVTESFQILRDPRINDEKRFNVLPPKDLIISFENEHNGVVYEEQFMFGGSIIIDLDNKTNFAVAVNKISKI